jgi:hypothetical protein
VRKSSDLYGNGYRNSTKLSMEENGVDIAAATQIAIPSRYSHCRCRHVYSCSQWHLYTRSDSTASVLNINELPEIITVREPDGLCGQSVTFTVNAELRQSKLSMAEGGVNIGGATGSSYNHSGYSSCGCGSYDVVVSGTCTPSVTSAAATLIINALPVITGNRLRAKRCVKEVQRPLP